MSGFTPSSRGLLSKYDLGRFPGDALFERIARALCDAECLPRKELYESWEMARRIRRRLRGGRILDVAGGHGLLAHLMLLLDDSSANAIVVDTAVPPSSAAVHAALVQGWPRLSGRIAFVEASVEELAIDFSDLVVSSHACGALTDRLLDRVIAARARVAVLPCSHDFATCDAGDLSGWLDRPLAIDVVRAMRLRHHGYRIWTQTIPSTITPRIAC